MDFYLSKRNQKSNWLYPYKQKMEKLCYWLSLVQHILTTWIRSQDMYSKDQIVSKIKYLKKQKNNEWWLVKIIKWWKYKK